MSETKQYQPTDNDEDITLTPAAIAHITKQLAKRAEAIGIRFSVKAAGCSGLKYVIDYVDSENPEDKSIQVNDDITLYIDEQSYPFIKGMQVDFVKEKLNQVFKFTNPNQTGSCGCGESFTVKDA